MSELPTFSKKDEIIFYLLGRWFFVRLGRS